MSKTFKAFMKAEKEKQIKPEVTEKFDIKSQSQPYIPPNYIIPPQVLEEFYKMKSRILSSIPKETVKTLLFSSSSRGEGNSTILVNFAITLASAGDDVLLVDANLRNPTFHDLFNTDKIRGLTELLLDKVAIKDVVKKTQIENLSVITCGAPYSTPSSLLESKSLDYAIEQIKTQANWVLFDSPPINLYNDSSILATKVDGMVMVVEAEKTRWEVARSAKDQIENDKANIIGGVLNGRQMYIPEWAYRMR